MTRYKIIYSQEACNDLIAIHRYIVLQSFDLKIASRFVKRIRNAIESLKYFPFRYKKTDIPFRGLDDVRQFVTNNYLVQYSINEVLKTISIIGVISCRQEKK